MVVPTPPAGGSAPTPSGSPTPMGKVVSSPPPAGGPIRLRQLQLQWARWWCAFASWWLRWWLGPYAKWSNSNGQVGRLRQVVQLQWARWWFGSYASGGSGGQGGGSAPTPSNSKWSGSNFNGQSGQNNGQNSNFNGQSGQNNGQNSNRAKWSWFQLQ